MDEDDAVWGMVIGVLAFCGICALMALINATMFAFTGYWWHEEARLQAIVIGLWISIGIGIVVALKG